jgi:multidrug efflux pump
VTKNGILIVEFATQRLETGLDPLEAVVGAATARLRPILMTSVATVLGILPVALALGAGAESRKPLGVAVIGGMTSSLALTLFVVPAVYLLVARKPGHPKVG